MNNKEDGLKSGFDDKGNRVYGYLDFDISQLPNPEENRITECALKIKNKNKFKTKSDVRFYVELVELDEVGSYQDIKDRDKIEYIGYEVAESDLTNKNYQYAYQGQPNGGSHIPCFFFFMLLEIVAHNRYKRPVNSILSNEVPERVWNSKSNKKDIGKH